MGDIAQSDVDLVRQLLGKGHTPEALVERGWGDVLERIGHSPTRQDLAHTETQINKTPDRPTRFVRVSAAEVVLEDQEWHPTADLPLGCLAPMLGEEGVGKSLLTVAKSQAVAAGGDRVLYLTGEESWTRQIAPRLRAAGVDMRLVEYLALPEKRNRAARLSVTPRDVEELRWHITDAGAVWVVLDPFASFLPDGKNMAVQGEARAVLDPLADLAEESGACITPLIHLGRGQGSIRDRVQISAAIRQTARHTFAAVKNPEDDTQFYYGDDKSNVRQLEKAQRWQIGSRQVTGVKGPVPYAQCVGATDHYVRELEIADTGGDRSAHIAALVEFALELVPEGKDRLTADLKERLRRAGASEATTRTVMKRARLVSYHPEGQGGGAAWMTRRDMSC